MTMKLELVPIPVTDVDRAKAFDQVGFHADLDEHLRRRVPGRAADPARLRLLHLHRGRDRPDTPGSVQGLHLVVPDIRATRAELLERGRDQRGPGHGRPREATVSYAYFKDPDSNGWALQQLPY